MWWARAFLRVNLLEVQPKELKTILEASGHPELCESEEATPDNKVEIKDDEIELDPEGSNKPSALN